MKNEEIFENLYFNIFENLPLIDSDVFVSDFIDYLRYKKGNSDLCGVSTTDSYNYILDKVCGNLAGGNFVLKPLLIKSIMNFLDSDYIKEKCDSEKYLDIENKIDKDKMVIIRKDKTYHFDELVKTFYGIMITYSDLESQMGAWSFAIPLKNNIEDITDLEAHVIYEYVKQLFWTPMHHKDSCDLDALECFPSYSWKLVVEKTFEECLYLNPINLKVENFCPPSRSTLHYHVFDFIKDRKKYRTLEEVSSRIKEILSKSVGSFKYEVGNFNSIGDMFAKGYLTEGTIDSLAKTVNFFDKYKNTLEIDKEVEQVLKANIEEYSFGKDGKSKDEPIGFVHLNKDEDKESKKKTLIDRDKPFELLGRKEINSFFNEEIIDVVKNREVYSKFGIGFPEPFILEGPPGCGKTYAVKQLEEYLGWNSYHITSSSIGSSYIHATARLIEDTFKKAKESSPAMVIVDEMDSFMPNRAGARHTDSHVIEEVNCFLQCIQTATENNILVVGMTNFIRNIDPAILRSGRMGKHLTVSWASEEEIEQVMRFEINKRPFDETLDIKKYCSIFNQKPLSDVTSFIRKASMKAAKRRAEKIEQEDLDSCANEIKAENEKVTEVKRQIGFCA